MDTDTNSQNGDDHHDPPQPQSQQSNGHQNQESSTHHADESHHNTTSANETASSQPNSQAATQSNGPKPSQVNGNLGTQTPPSGQGDSKLTEEEPVDPKEPLEPFEWDDLEERFVQKMEECQKQEEEIEHEFREWCQKAHIPFHHQVFNAWASTTREHEEERLHKRKKSVTPNPSLQTQKSDPYHLSLSSSIIISSTPFSRLSSQLTQTNISTDIKVVQAFERMLALMECILERTKDGSTKDIVVDRTNEEVDAVAMDVVYDDEKKLKKEKEDSMVAVAVAVAEKDGVMDDERHESQEHFAIAGDEAGKGDKEARSSMFHTARCIVS
ncbi:MAG: hypothetical protein Q9169_002688 [Polycauliona sp. 2 TL-2023]